MLAKLLKYELRSTARLLLPVFGALIIFSMINRFLSPMRVDQPGFLYTIITIITMFIYVILMVGMFVMTLVIMIQRFYKNLLGDEGYLMFTLPLQTWKHIVVKLLVALLWVITSCITAFNSILIISKQRISFSEISNGIRTMGLQVGINGYLLVFEMILLGLLCLAAGILLLYGAIALGQTFNKYKFMATFGVFIVLNVICQILLVIYLYVCDKIFNFANMSTPSGNEAQLMFLIAFLFTLLITGGSFVLTEVILKKKLNLE